MQCIFCHKDASLSRSVEHIIPESLGNKHHFLPRGYVCDECNHYFSIKIEKPLLSSPYFESLRFRNDIRSKKGNRVKHTFYFPGAQKSAEGILERGSNGELLFSFYDEEIYESIEKGNCRKAISPYLPEPIYPYILLSRLLAKCAYEFFLYNMRIEKYDLCVQELLGTENDILKPLREYARYGKGAFWQYNQRRIYSEGAIISNNREHKTYEILHEMRLFPKDHIILPNGMVEAEIYFVVAICGIEYAICLSNPDISGYQEWLTNNNNKSPLEVDYETVIPFGLSDINPLLIKEDTQVPAHATKQ